MSRTARLWKGAGPLAWGACCCPASWSVPPSRPRCRSSSPISAVRPSPGASPVQARTFFRKALEIDPANAEARRRPEPVSPQSAVSPSRTRPPPSRRCQPRPRPAAPAGGPRSGPADARDPGHPAPAAPNAAALRPRSRSRSTAPPPRIRHRAEAQRDAREPRRMEDIAAAATRRRHPPADQGRARPGQRGPARGGARTP